MSSGDDSTGLGPPGMEDADTEPPASASSSSQSLVMPERSKVDPALDALVGSTLANRYEIIRRIGEGGMGAVYEARHTVIGKRVAVKVLLERLVEKRELVGRLLKEARLASAIGHENIVDVTDFGTTDDARSFVVMEYLEGEPLSALLAREAPLPVERCLRIVRQVASALEAAHAKGIVHRDIKPENVYLVRRGDDDFVKVVDFGVSKAVRTADEGPETLRLTRTGMLLGTPLYMSPEQARGDEDIDARADVWAVGVVLYECLTGEVPFRANNYLQVIAQVLNHEALPPSKMLPELGIPAAVESVVMKALAKDRDERYQQMADLRRDLERLLSGDPNVTLDEPTTQVRLDPPKVGPRWHLGIAAVLAMGIGLALALAQPEADDEAPLEEAAGVEPPPALPAASWPSRSRPEEAPPAPPPPSEAPPPPALEAPSRPPLAETPVRVRKPAAAKRPEDVSNLPPAPVPPGENIRFVGDDVAPSSEKIFGRKPTPKEATP